MASSISAGNATNGVIVSSDNTGALNLITGSGSGTTAVTIDSSQNVGIGTTSPRSVAGYTTLGINNTTGGFTDIFAANTRVASFGADASSTYVSAVASAPILFSTGNTERMRLDSAGAFIVGGSSANYGGRVEIVRNGERCLVLHNTATGSGANSIQDFYRNTVLVGSITTTNANTTYGTSSDYRLKENVQPMVGALNKVAQLKPCTYNWKIDGSDGQGFIAHELAEIVPDAVVGAKDAVNDDGSIKPQNIDTSYLVATLTAAIQELKAELDVLKAKVGE
jgi:hypothetical protein